MKKLNLEISYVMETSYENGTYWVNYEANGKPSIEIIHGTDVRNAMDNFLKLGLDEISNKRDINTISYDLKGLVEMCYQSDNDMWYVEEGEEDEYDLEALEKEVEELGLGEFIEFYNDGVTPITVYGGVICLFFY